MIQFDWPDMSPKLCKGRRRLREGLAHAKAAARERNNPVHRTDLPPAPPPSVVLVEGVDVASREFLWTYAWRTVRYKALRMAKGCCECCGSSPKDGIRLNVDHIQPRQRRPDLALDPYNLQVLCDDCNAGKGNWDESDWR